MAVLKLRKFGDFESMELHLQGGIKFQPFNGSRSVNQVIYGLNGLTLTFTTPTATVTFADTTGAGLSLKNILDQINGTSAFNTTAVARVKKDSIQLVQKTPAAGIVLTGGTACSLLGIPGTGMSGTFYGSPMAAAAPRMVSVETFGPSESAFLLVTEE